MKLNINCCDGIYDSLDVRFTKSCDNRCTFCIENHTNFGYQGYAPVQTLIDNTIKSGISSVLILGGEPLLKIWDKELLKYLIGIRAHVKTIYITTSLPKTIIDYWDIFVKIMYFVDGLNVSFQHYDWEENNKIMNVTSNHNRFELLKRITDVYSNKTRVAVNLVKDGIDSEWKLDQFIQIARKHGAKTIKINELCHSEENYVSYEKIMKIKMKSPYTYGCQSELFEWYPGINIIIKRSCFVTENSLDATLLDLIKVLIRKIFRVRTKNRFSVLYENGSIYHDWQTGEKQ